MLRNVTPYLFFNGNCKQALDFDSEEAVNTAYERLKKDGQVQIELANMFWGAKYAKLIDKFNIGWDLNYTYPQSEQ